MFVVVLGDEMNLNCEEIMNKIADSYYEFADFEINNDDLLGKNYAYAVVNMCEEGYRNYNEVRNDIIQKAKDLMPGAAVTYVHQKPTRPDTEYEIQICTKNSDLCFELFLWNVEFIHNEK